MATDLQPQIVVITDEQDAHLPFVQKHLDQPLIVIDPRRLLEEAELSYELEGSTMVASYQGMRLDAVRGVWYRKPREIEQADVHVPDELMAYSLTAMRYHANQLLTCWQDATWVSDFHALRKANNKAWQLQVAAQIGFNTPRTLMTSDPARAKQFIDTEGTCIVKAYAAYAPNYKHTPKSFLTRVIASSKLPNLANMHLAPSIFQQYIETAFDVRVTVIGEQVFAAVIKNDTLDKESPVRDWRMGHYEGNMRIEEYHDFPADVAAMCVEHNKRLNLTYGAIDLVMGTDGKLWFLENNPNGQWAFVEKATGQQLGKAMADLLAG